MFNTMQWVWFSQILIACYADKNNSALTIVKFNLTPENVFDSGKAWAAEIITSC